MSTSLELENPQLFMPPPSLVAKMKTRAAELQMLPSVAIEAMNVSKKPDCSISEYASIVERDVKLTSDILKLANSALYCASSTIISLHQAVIRLGLMQCQNLILTASVASIMKRISFQQEEIRTTLSQHGFTTALLSMYLNHTCRLGFIGEEFTAGLIHDFGRTLLAITEPDQFAAIDPLDFDETTDVLSHERETVGTDHCLLGAYYAIHQRLPVPLQEVILWHHQPEGAKAYPKLTALIAVCDHMANHLQRYNEASNYEAYQNPFLPALAKFADSRFETTFIDKSTELMDKAWRDAAAMIHS